MSPTTADLLDGVKTAAELALRQANALWPKVMASPMLLAAPAVVLLLAFAGYEVMRRDDDRFRRLRRTWFVSGIACLLLAFAGLAAESFSGGDLSGWSIGNAALGALALGAGLVLAGIGFVLGGLLGGRGTHLRRGYPVVIAIDGPAASGKGTLAKRIADFYKLPCLDTGLLYRAVARDVLAAGLSLEDAPAALSAAKLLNPSSLDDEGLRTAVAGEAASVVAKFPNVRAELLVYQRAFAAKQKRGAVLDGRDIGTIVCPAADVKIYVTATSEERARRRHLELEARGDTVTYETVLEDIRRRDSRDIGRTIAPLWPAKDAITLDTTKLDANRAFEAALRIVADRLKASKNQD